MQIHFAATLFYKIYAQYTYDNARRNIVYMNLPEDEYFKEVTKQVLTNSLIGVRYWTPFM